MGSREALGADASRKKLAEIQTLEERMRAGTTLSMGQIKKIESKA